MSRLSTALLAISVCSTAGTAQQPTHIGYTLRVDSTSYALFDVEMRFRSSAQSFTLAAAAHPEYDDKYWRYLENLQVTNAGGAAVTITRTDSVLWRVRTAPGDIVVRYRIRPPAAPPLRAAWRSFLTARGGISGGPYSFLYVLGAENARATVSLTIPRGWRVATGLHAVGARTFMAANIAELMDSPILMGTMSSWNFNVKGVAHRVAYLKTSATVPFDSVAFVRGLERYTREAVAVFGAMPYNAFTFLFEDDAFSGGLEHHNSVSVGAPSVELAKDPNGHILDTAHEFFHTWNLMSIRPLEYRSVDYRAQPPVAGLWFSEGLTMFYADLLVRRAGLPADSTRLGHLAGLIRSYVANEGNSRFSAEAVSRVEYNSEPGALGDFSPSTHLQGEVMGNMLDMRIRSATHGAKSMDDVMRLMYQRFSVRGFTGADVEKAVTDVCACGVKDFFDAHVRGAGPIDFNRYLGLMGLQAEISRAPALDDSGKPAADMRIRGWESQDGLRLMLWNPASIWVRAGFHTGDRVVSMNGAPLATWRDMRTLLGSLVIGDTVRIEVLRPAGRFAAAVRISGYDTPAVQITETSDASAEQKRLRMAWLGGH